MLGRNQGNFWRSGISAKNYNPSQAQHRQQRAMGDIYDQKFWISSLDRTRTIRYVRCRSPDKNLDSRNYECL